MVRKNAGGAGAGAGMEEGGWMVGSVTDGEK
jgi:hypothetical protein